MVVAIVQIYIIFREFDKHELTPQIYVIKLTHLFNKYVNKFSDYYVGGDSSVTEPPTRPTPLEPTVIVTITNSSIRIQEVGSSINFTCYAQSRNTRSRLPIRWTKRDGVLPLGRSYVDDNYGILHITNLQVTDSGVYVCETNDGINTAQATVSLRVPGMYHISYTRSIVY